MHTCRIVHVNFNIIAVPAYPRGGVMKPGTSPTLGVPSTANIMNITAVRMCACCQWSVHVLGARRLLHEWLDVLCGFDAVWL